MRATPDFSFGALLMLPIAILIISGFIALTIWAVRSVSKNNWLPSLLGVVFLLIVGIGAGSLFFVQVRSEPVRQEAHAKEVQVTLEARLAELERDREATIVDSSPGVTEENNLDIEELVDGLNSPEEIPIESETKTNTPALPEWVTTGKSVGEAPPHGNAEYVIVSSKKHAFSGDAFNEAVAEATRVATQYLYMQRPEMRGWRPDQQLMQQYAVYRNHHIEEPPKYGRLNISRHRYYLQVRLWPGLIEKMEPSWKAEVRNTRVAQLGLGFGFLTLIVGTASTYLRVDNATRGNHRGKLKAAAIATIATGAAVVSLIA